MKMLDTTPQLFDREKAIAIAAELKAGDPEWDYVPKHDPKGTGFSFIEVFDENGELVGKV